MFLQATQRGRALVMPNDAERKDFYFSICWNCGYEVCTNMYGMGRCKKCGVRLPEGADEAEEERLKKQEELRRKVAVAMFAPLETKGFHPSASQMTEAQRVIELVRRG
jgi:hypothetical protein